MFWGTLQPSLPPRPNFPKSPSPQENTRPRARRTREAASPHAPLSGHRQAQLTFVGQSQRLGVSAPTGHLHHSVTDEDLHLLNRKGKTESSAGTGEGRGLLQAERRRRARAARSPTPRPSLPRPGGGALPASAVSARDHHFGLQLRRVVPVPQPAILAEAPGVQLAAGREGCAVRAPTGDVPDAPALQGLDEPRFVTVPRAGGVTVSMTNAAFPTGEEGHPR